MPKLVVSDVDGTLLLKGEERISSSGIDAVNAVKEKGIKFAVASGRTYRSLYSLFEKSEKDLYFICCDGSATIYNGKVLYTRQISVSDIFSIINCDMYNDCVFVLCCPTRSYVLKDCDEGFCEEVYRQTGEKLYFAEKLYDIKEPVIKICVYRSGANVKPMPFMPKSLRVSYLSLGWCEYVSAISDKGLAVSDLQMRLYLSKLDTACIGDGENDVAMMKKAKDAVCVADAHPLLCNVCTRQVQTALEYLNSIM